MKERKHLSEQEVHSLISSLPDSINHIRNQCLIAVCFSHGLRASELTGLMLSDVNIDEKPFILPAENGLSTNQPLQSLEYQLLIQWLEQRNASVHYAEPAFSFPQRRAVIPPANIQDYPRQRIVRRSEYCGTSSYAAPCLRLCISRQRNRHPLIQDYLGHRNIQHTVLYTASNVARFRSIKL